MDKRTRSTVGGGILLILVGLVVLAYQVRPDLFTWLRLEMSWPVIVMGVGLFLLLFGLVVGAPEMAVPASIVGGIGALLYWQNMTGEWESWAYAWTLIPGFVGVGAILSGILGDGKLRSDLEGGAWMILISVTIFSIFSALFGGPNLLGPYWPVLLILLGLIFLGRSLLRGNRQR